MTETGDFGSALVTFSLGCHGACAWFQKGLGPGSVGGEPCNPVQDGDDTATLETELEKSGEVGVFCLARIP